MTKTWIIAALAFALAATLAPDSADARRLSGGKSLGMQRNMPARTAPDAARPATPPPQQAAPAAAQNPAAGAAANPAAAAGKRNWLGPLAGIAAGLGLAALMSHLGLGEAFGSFLLLALVVVAAIALIAFIRRRAAGPALAGAGAGGPGAARVEPALTPAAAPAATPSGGVFVPAAFDHEGFARIAKMIFIRLQAAHDSGNLDDLRQFTTPEMFASVKLDLLERGSQAQSTEVRRIEATVLDVAEEAERQIVSVRYRGEVVEAAGAAPVEVDEVWHLAKARSGDDAWRIAGIEQMA
ncbi:MAG: Tim44 domain-containing protein [Comamonadaceae bacterium]|nr:Tim44 domain-containing protein [Comamonadaceae bacterium]